MSTGYSGQAIQSVLNSIQGFCKFLSANDTGATGGHQSGILISKSAVDMLFTRRQLEEERIPKRSVKVKWQNDFVTESIFTFYESKNELRVTRFGRGFPFLNVDQTERLLTGLTWSILFLEHWNMQDMDKSLQKVFNRWMSLLRLLIWC